MRQQRPLIYYGVSLLSESQIKKLRFDTSKDEIEGGRKSR
jgi:hypothetical protein